MLEQFIDKPNYTLDLPKGLNFHEIIIERLILNLHASCT